MEEGEEEREVWAEHKFFDFSDLISLSGINFPKKKISFSYHSTKALPFLLSFSPSQPSFAPYNNNNE
jgi:hypothetical protein